MKISCLLYGQFQRFQVVEWDETEDSVVYRVSNDIQTAYYECPRVTSLEALAQVGIAALAIDGISDIKEWK